MHEALIDWGVDEGEGGERATVAESLVECLRREERGAQCDSAEFGHTCDGVDGKVDVVWAINALAIEIAVADAAWFCPLVVPVETEVPLWRMMRRREEGRMGRT